MPEVHTRVGTGWRAITDATDLATLDKAGLKTRLYEARAT